MHELTDTDRRYFEDTWEAIVAGPLADLGESLRELDHAGRMAFWQSDTPAPREPVA